MQKTVLLGVGRMGSAFIDRWIEAGRVVTVWNRTPRAVEALPGGSVQVAATPQDAVQNADVVITMLSDGPAVRSVLLGLGVVSNMREEATLVDLSTIDVSTSQDLARTADQHGIHYVRGAVSGTPAVVREGTASLLLSGDPTAILSIERVLREIAPTFSVLGTHEEARVVKILINSMLGGTAQMLAEATVACEAQGIPRETLLNALESTVIASRFSTYKSQALQERDFRPTFTTADMRKDLNLATDLARSVGVVMPVADLVGKQLDATCNAGFQSQDFLSLICYLQQSSGVAPDISGD